MPINNTHRIARNYLWLTAGDIVGRGLVFLAFVYLARVLGAAAFGLYTFAFAFLIYLELLADAGLTLLGTRDLAAGKGDRAALAGNIFAARAALALLIFVVSLLTAWFLPIPHLLKLLLMGNFLYIICRALNADWIFAGLERMEYIAATRVAFGLAYVLLVIVFVKDAGQLVWVPVLYFAGGAVVYAFFLVLAFRAFLPVSLRQLKPGRWAGDILEAFPLGTSLILAQVYNNLDVIMLGVMGKPETVAFYNVAYKLYFSLAGFYVLWQAAVFPVVSRKLAGGPDSLAGFINKYLRLTFAVVIPLTFLCFGLAAPLIRLLFGAEYLPAIPALQILIWTMMLVVVTGVGGALVLIPAGQTRGYLLSVSFGVLANFLLNLVLIPAYGFIGSAVATVISEAAVAAIMIYLIRRTVRLELVRSAGPYLVFSGLALLALLAAVRCLPNWFGYVLGAAAFIAVYSLVLTRTDERRFFSGFIAKLKGEADPG